MKKISEQELIELIGGTTTGKCDYLQDMAAEHETYDSEDAEDGWWEAWSIAFEKCANS